MAARKKKTQTFHYCNPDNKKKNDPTPTTYYTYDNTKKKNSYWIPFIVNVINDCHNNAKVVKRR
jgi:hypothetical protein